MKSIKKTNNNKKKRHSVKSVRSEKPLFKKISSWAGLITAILTIATLIILDLPKKIRETYFLNGNANMPETAPKQDMEIDQILSGIVWGEDNEPLAGINVILPEYDKMVTTDQYGKFRFKVKATKNRPVNLIARKQGFKTFDIDATLGNASFNFTIL